MDFKVEPIDLIHDKFIEKNEHDRVLRCTVFCHDEINVEKIEAAVNLLVKKVPILNTVLIDDGKKLYWHERKTTEGIFKVFSKVTYFDAEYTSVIDETTEPQFKTLVIGSTICFLVNNMLMDLYGFKNLLYLFFDLYNNANGNENYHSSYEANHSRDIKEYLKTVDYKSGKFNLLKLCNKNFNLVRLPDSELLDDKAFTLTHQIQINEFEYDKLEEICQATNHTITNVIFAAYHRAVANVCKINDTHINIARFFDGREFSKVNNYISLSNIHTILPYSLYFDEDDTFEQTLEKITKTDNLIRKNHLVEKKISCNPKKLYKDTEYFQYCNIGPLSVYAFDVHDNSIKNVVFTTACREHPNLAIASSIFDRKISLTAMNNCTLSNHKFIMYFLEWMVYEIKTFIFNHDKNFFVNPETSIYAEDSYNSNEYEDSILDANKMFENIQVIKNTNEVEKDFKEAEEKLEKRIEEKKEALEQKVEEKSEKKAKKVTKKEDANSISEETKSLIEKFSKVANKTPDEIQIIDNNTVRYLNTINGKSVWQKRSIKELEKYIAYKENK